MAHYLITLIDTDPDVDDCHIVEGSSAVEATEKLSVPPGTELEVWTLRSSEPRRFRVVEETQRRLIPLEGE